MGFTLSTLISWFKFDKDIVKPETFNPLIIECTEENNEVHLLSKPFDELSTALQLLQASDLDSFDNDKFSPRLYLKLEHRFKSNKQIFKGLDEIASIFESQLKDVHSENYIDDPEIVLDRTQLKKSSFGAFFVRGLSTDEDEYITFKTVILGMITKLERAVSAYGGVNNHPIIDITTKEYFDRKLAVFSEEVLHYVNNLIEHGTITNGK